MECLKGCDDHDVKAWLLRDGFRNEVMNEYLAHLAATTGGLYSALLEPEVDDALLDGAGAILAALAQGGPAKDMNDYEDAVPAMHRYAELIATADPTLGRLDDLLTIGSVTRRTEEEFGWPAGEPERLVARYRALLDRPAWSELVRAHLTDPVGDYEFNVALSCAGRLGMAALPYALAHLESDPFDAYVWQWAMQHAGPGTVTEVTDLAERLIPLDGIGTGPDRNIGFGPGHASDRAFETVVNGLDRHRERERDSRSSARPWQATSSGFAAPLCGPCRPGHGSPFPARRSTGSTRLRGERPTTSSARR